MGMNSCRCIGLLLAALSPMAAARATGPYRYDGVIRIGGPGGWDYMQVDPGARRLYVSHATKVVVIDIDRRAIVGEVSDTPGVHGIAIAPELGRGFVSDGRASCASVFDLGSLRTVSRSATGENPDAIVYDRGRREAVTFNGRSHSATVIDAPTGRVISTIPLPGRPEFAAVDSVAGRIYDNIEDMNEVAVIDTGTHRVVALWPIAPGESASGMAIDRVHHRLFVGCRNRLMVVMDSTDGRVVSTLQIDGGVDANAFDSGTQLAFSSNGAGTVTVVRELGPDSFQVVQTLPTVRGARTMALDPRTHAIYLAVADFEPQPEPQPGGPRPWPKVVPGTFRILVYAYAP
jgi:DNA-binding beta-propeller fold protein YncE